MSPAFLVRLRPTTPWRTGSDSGERHRTEAIYHSDALYSAVCSAMDRLGRLPEWLAATAGASGEPSVRFSSCFPFCGDTLYFAPPRHLWPPSAAGRQRWKGARFVPRPIVERLIAGKGVEEERWTVDASSQCLLAVDRRGAAPTPFRLTIRSSAAVDRLGSGGVEAHSAACLEFAPEAGLWFVVLFRSEPAREEWASDVRAALRLLADSGYGGGRSRGWGRTEMPEITEGELPDLILHVDFPRNAVERKVASPALEKPEPAAVLLPEVIEEEAVPKQEAEIAAVSVTVTADEPAAEEPVVAEPSAAEAPPAEQAPTVEADVHAGSDETPDALSAESEPTPPVMALAVPPVTPPPPATTAFWLLSLYSPGAADTIDWQRGAYCVVERSGRVESSAGSGGRKQSVRMVAEGSVVMAAADPCGAAPDVAPEGHPHPVYRAGYAVSIPIPWRSV